MRGLMMDYQLTLPTLLRRAETYFPDKEIVSRLQDASFHRTNYRHLMRRSKQLAVALRELGLEPGDRVATLCWNHSQHMECYFGIPCGGFVLHTLNIRLHPTDLAYIASHAGDRAVVVDEMLVPVLEQFIGETQIEHVFVVESNYEELLAGASADDWSDPKLDENEAAAMCYTSGTTGRPKGVVYSHRSTILHTLGVASGSRLGMSFGEGDTFLPVVPMFHANAWGYPYLAAMLGAKIVYPGPLMDPHSLLEAFEREKVTWAAGVPTIWMGILNVLDAEPDRYDLSAMKGMLVGGSAAPRALIAGFEQRHGISICHGWGMTETSPVASVTDLPGELECRGPWVAASYFETPEQADRWTDDGWFCTGDIVSIDDKGFIAIKDRSKDVIKSGGEWISSVDLENALMGHPAVAEAAVIAIPDEKWTERPLAVVVLKPGEKATAEELREFLAERFAKWWLPDAFEFVDEIPKTAVGKFRKTALREMFVKQPAQAK